MRYFSPRWRRWAPVVLTGVVCLLVLSLVAYALYGPMRPDSGVPPNSGRPATQWVEIDGLDLIVTYTASAGGPTGYFSPPPDCGRCPMNVTPGAVWNVTFTLNNTDATHLRNLSAVSLDAPFAFEGATPGFPIVVPPGGSVTITLSIATPRSSGTYFVAGTLDAS